MKVKEISKRYAKELFGSIIGYAVMLVGVIWLVNGPFENSNLRYMLIVLPMVPVLFTVRAIVRYLSDTDEFERELQLKSLAVSLAGTAFITFTYGFLEQVGLPKISMFAVWPLIATLWVGARFYLNRQYQ